MSSTHILRTARDPSTGVRKEVACSTRLDRHIKTVFLTAIGLELGGLLLRVGMFHLGGLLLRVGMFLCLDLFVR